MERSAGNRVIDVLADVLARNAAIGLTSALDAAVNCTRSKNAAKSSGSRHCTELLHLEDYDRRTLDFAPKPRRS
jgi:hypothetical protein